MMDAQLKDPEWYPLLPEGWKMVRVKTAIESFDSGVWGEDPYDDDSSTPVIRSNELDAGGNWRVTTPALRLLSSSEKKQARLREGDLVIVKSSGSHAHIGKTAVVTKEIEEIESCFSNFTGRIRVLPHRTNSRFLWYFLNNSPGRDQLFYYGTTTTGLINLSATSIGVGVFALPPLSEQQRIAAYLDASCAAIDAAVASKRRQLEILDEIRKSAAHQVLSEGLRPGLPLKDSGIESIGVIPAHWDVKQIRYACEVNYGITLQLEKGQSVGDGVRILTVSNLTIDGNLDLEDEYYIDPAELTKSDYLRRGDLLFNWRNGSQYHVGKTAFFDMEGEVAHVSFLLRIRCGRHMNPFFLRSYLGILKDAGFFSGAKDKVNKTFNSSELKRLRVVIPPRDEQKEVCAEIERRTKECNVVKAAIETQIATLTAYRKSLIHECVTGQRRVMEGDLVCVGRGKSLSSRPSR